MARTFRGEYPQKIDNKGRVSIPAAFRRVLVASDPDCASDPGRDPTLIIVFGDERRDFLECYSVEQFERIEAKLCAMKPGPRKDYLRRFYSTLSWDTQVDQTGRIVLPKRLRDKLGIGETGDMMFAGTTETFQIWNAPVYDAAHAVSNAAAFDGFPEDADPSMLFDPED